MKGNHFTDASKLSWRKFYCGSLDLIISPLCDILISEFGFEELKFTETFAVNGWKNINEEIHKDDCEDTKYLYGIIQSFISKNKKYYEEIWEGKPDNHIADVKKDSVYFEEHKKLKEKKNAEIYG